MTHLAPDELIDAMDGTLTAARRGHLDTCGQCRREAAALRVLMSEVRDSDVPEPSPLFWDRFSARVRVAIADDAPVSVRRWFQWPVLAPLGALALLVFALVSAIPSRTGDSSAQRTLATATANRVAEPVDLDSQWALLAELVGDLDFESANAQGIATPPGAADAAVLRLSLGEQQELLRLLREELRVGG